MRIRFTLLVVAFLAVLMAGPGMVGAYSLSDIDFWVGSGAKEVGIVIDFNDGSATQSFAWGYRYDEEDIGTGASAKTRFLDAATMALVEADAHLNAAYELYGANKNVPYWYFLEYQGHVQDADPNDLVKMMSGMWLPLGTNATELNGGEVWSQLASLNQDMQWLTWTWAAGFVTPGSVDVPVSASSGTSIPTTPEPGSIFLLGLGMTGLATFCRTRVRR